MVGAARRSDRYWAMTTAQGEARPPCGLVPGLTIG